MEAKIRNTPITWDTVRIPDFANSDVLSPPARYSQRTIFLKSVDENFIGDHNAINVVTQHIVNSGKEVCCINPEEK